MAGAARARPGRSRPATKARKPKPAPKPGTGRPKPAPRRAAPKATRRAGEDTAKHLVRPAKTKYEPKTAGPASTESDRLKAIHAALEGRLRHHFPDAQPIFTYGMHGWKVPRRRTVAWTTGTMDPNWLAVLLAERKAGITLHVWNPVDPGILQKRERELSAAGLKPMVGCLQFTRKGDYPLDAIDDLFGRIRQQMDQEAKA